MEQCDPAVQPHRRRKRPIWGQHVSSPDLVGIDTAQIDRDPASGRDAFDLFLMLLEAAHPHGLASGIDRQLLARTNLAIEQGACHHRPEPPHRERPVHW